MFGRTKSGKLIPQKCGCGPPANGEITLFYAKKRLLHDPLFWRRDPEMRLRIIGMMNLDDQEAEAAYYHAWPVADPETGEEKWMHYGYGPDTLKEAMDKL